MQILLASAKIMKERCKSCGLVPHIPLFRKQALSLADDLSHCTADEHLSDPSLLKDFSYEGFSFANDDSGSFQFIAKDK